MTAIDTLINRSNKELEEPYKKGKIYRLHREPGTPTPFEWVQSELKKAGKPYLWEDIREKGYLSEVQQKLDDWKELHGYPRDMGLTLEDAGLASKDEITQEMIDNGFLQLNLMTARVTEEEHIKSMLLYPSDVAHYFSYGFSQRKKQFIANMLPYSFSEEDKNIVHHPLFKEKTEEEAMVLLGWNTEPEMYAQYLEGKKYWLKEDIKRYANTYPLIAESLGKQLYQLEKLPAQLTSTLAAIRKKWKLTTANESK